MSKPDIMSRLRNGDVLLMDGATGSELHRMGVDVNKGTPGDWSTHGAWSATANLEAPEEVQLVHQSYLDLGVEVIISNNFWTNRTHLGFAGLADRWEEYARAGVENALAARDGSNPDAYVAGGFAPPEEGDVPQTMTEVAAVLADSGVDVLLPEYLGPVEQCVQAVEACAGLGLPVWIGVRHPTENGDLESGETFEDLVKALEGHRVDAILPMCHPPERLSAALRNLRKVYQGPTGAYANVGYYSAKTAGAWDTSETDVKYSAGEQADYASEWLELGAQVIGGCCGVGPAHIEAMSAVVGSARPR